MRIYATFVLRLRKLLPCFECRQFMNTWYLTMFLEWMSLSGPIPVAIGIASCIVLMKILCTNWLVLIRKIIVLNLRFLKIYGLIFFVLQKFYI